MANLIRTWAVLSVLSLAGCIHEGKSPPMPASVSPGWKLNDLQLRGDEWDAVYSGPGTAHVRVWAIHGTAEGLDRVQKWQARPDTVVVYSARYFAAVDWSGTSRDEAGALVRAVERTLQ